MMKKILLITIGCVALNIAQSHAVIISAWDTSSLTGTTSGSLNATTTAADTATGVLSRSGGLTAASLGGGYSSTGWTNSFSAASTQFYQFTVSASSGFTLSFSSISLNFRNTNTGVRSLQWTYSLDNFATAGINVGNEFSLPGATTSAAYGPVSLTGVTGLQSVAGTITFRLYGWNATGNLAAGGSGAIGTDAGNDVVFNGTINPVAVPEPSAFALAGLGAAFLLYRRKRPA